MDVLDANDSNIPYCDEDGVWNITMAGTAALRECPENYSDNVVRRFCAMVDAHKAAWQLEDFSECVSNNFARVIEDVSRTRVS